jgi:hypothetical protein
MRWQPLGQITVKQGLSSALERIQHAGGRASVTLDQIEEQMGSKQLLTRMNQVTHSSPSTADAIALKRIARKPTPAPMTGATGKPSAETSLVLVMASDIRVVTTCDSMNPSDFEVFLQIHKGSGWTNIVTYSFKNGRGMRWVHGAEGWSNTLKLDLPCSVVLEMAGEDLQRNWLLYRHLYLEQVKANRIAYSA